MVGATNNYSAAVRMPDLRDAPTHEILLAILRTVELTPDRYIVQSWRATSTRMEQVFSLRAILHTSGDEHARLKAEGHDGETEWAFIRGTELDKNIAWVEYSADINRIMNLIVSELEKKISISASMRKMQRQQVEEAIAEQHKKGTPIATFEVLKERLRHVSAQENEADPEDPQASKENTKAGAPGDLQSASGQHSAATSIVLAGDVKDMELENVLQSIGLCKMSGALLINNQVEQATIYFLDGTLMDATLEGGFALADHNAGYLRGEQAFLEVLTWASGAFSFEQTRRSSVTSINRKTHALLMEGMMLRDYGESLQKKGINNETRFVQTIADLSEEKFAQELNKGISADADFQRFVYLSLRQPTSLYEILKLRPMSKTIWMPAFFNLLSLELIAVADDSRAVQKKAADDEFHVEESKVNHFANELVRPDSGMVSHAAFSYLVHKEQLRFKKTRRPFSVLVFELKSYRGSTVEPLSNHALKEACRRFQSIMGELDTIGHYQSLDFALLLPEAAIAQSSGLFEACVQVLKSPPLPGIENEDQLDMVISLYMPDAGGRILLKDRKEYGKK